ncbi:unnamed protein product [Rotaria sp. Silwood1]|nr:unnamed protein product [Rotaria sp. Silwood1]
MSESKDLAVSVTNAWKNYGHWYKSITVLHDINLHVPTGIIYGLLGPSGCGKTTLLRCIVGRLELNRGEIIVLGKRPGSRGHGVPGRSVGFMPQETALYKNFSISEMLHHFGRLHNMSHKDILSREEFLVSFLDLPSKSKNVSQLSGGQQRRVSLACALLQQPQLLILDEPTVGVDPLLREKIWSHLINISKTIGRLELNRGEIIVLGKRPGSRGHGVPGRSVGFMPQETALYKNFSISEMLHHFGRLHNMSRKDILSREEFLVSFLDLPSKSKNVSQLSGGQQRRVSLACALLEQPQLLILDEPTVGVDPLLREKIWSHLINISKTSKTTIIITTHYIEEARKADRVGLMRSGRMLAEDEPSLLLNKYNQTSLENVFLQLCFQDQNRFQQEISMNNTDGDKDTDIPDNIDDQNSSATSIQVSVNRTNGNVLPLDNRSRKFEKNPLIYAKRVAADYFILPHMHKIYALMLKDLTVIKRSIGFLLFQFLIPVIQVALFCLCIGREPEHIPMALYNSEAIHGFPTGNLSLQLLNKINPEQIHFTSFNEFDKAMDVVKQGHYWGAAIIQFNFTQAIKNKLLGFQTDPATLNASSLHLYLDMTNQQVSLTMQSIILNSTEVFLKEVLSSYKIDPSIADPPVIIENPLYGNIVPQFLNFAAPGMMISIIFFLAIGLTALIFVVEKKEGLLERSWIAGVTTIEVMLAHIIVKFFIQFIQIMLLLVFADFIFKVEIKGSIFLAMTLIFMQGICGMSYGLLISSVCEQEIEVMEVALGSVFPILLSSGVIWPLEGMPSVMRFLSNFTPLTHSVEAMRCIAARSIVFFDLYKQINLRHV